MPTRDFLRLFLPALAVVATLPILAARAEAAPAVVDGRTIELPVPSGYCAIDRDRSPDAQAWEEMRGMQEPQNHLLAWFVVCDELERWRADPQRALERHAMVLARADMPALSRREVATAMAGDFDRARGVIGVGPMSMHLLESRDDAVLATMTRQVDGPAGPRRVIAVITFTSLNRALVTTNFYALDVGPEALQPVREAAIAYLASLIAANPEPRSRFVWLLAAAAAALAALAGGGFYWLRRRRRPA